MKLLSRAIAFIHPQLEDFGITPIESMSCGRPVIAYGKGGAVETVVPGVTGVLFYEQTWNVLFEVIESFDALAWNPEAIHAHALKFGGGVFETRLRELVEREYGKLGG